MKLLASLLLLASCAPAHAYDYYQGSQNVINTYSPPKVIYVAPQQRYVPPATYTPPATYYAPPSNYVAPTTNYNQYQPIVTPQQNYNFGVE
jgi:hypothetical protein